MVSFVITNRLSMPLAPWTDK